MQINNIFYSADKCRKPCKQINFAGEQNNGYKERTRYKHFEQMSDDVLSARSIIKAHQKAQNSSKMCLYKAIPSIAAGIIATSLAITRPGKISAKAATGLGFLATVVGVNAISDIATNNDSSKKKKAFATLGGLTTAAAGAYLMTKDFGKADKVLGFISKETTQLANELNKTKLAKFSNKHIEPFLKKHPKAEFLTPFVTAITAGILGRSARKGLSKSISNDIKNDACDSFIQTKKLQQEAKKRFDAIDAIEI